MIDIGGVGLLLHTPVSSYDRFGREGEVAELVTHLHVRDDAIDLYGFSEERERRLFRMLLTVSGIGPRSALGILSGMSVDGLQSAILSGDVASLTRIPGVGRKTAQRIVVELKSPLSEGAETVLVTGAVGGGDRMGGAVEALVALGYRRTDAYRSVARVLKASGAEMTLEELVRRVLAASMADSPCDDTDELSSSSEVRK